MEKAYAGVNNFYLMVIAFVAGTMALIYTKAIMIPFVISFFIFAIVSLLNRWFRERLRFPGWVAMTVTLVLFLVGAIVITVFMVNSVESVIKSSAIYRDQIGALVTEGMELLKEHGVELNEGLIRRELLKGSSLSFVTGLTGGAIGIMTNVVLVFIFTLFLLAGEGPVRQHSLIEAIHLKVARYITTKSFTSLLTAILVGLLLLSFGVELALMFAVLTFLLNFIPSIGSIVAVLVPMPVLLLQFGLDWKFWVIMAVSGSIQFSIGNLIEPKLMGENLNLHPVTVLIFLMFWGLVWGVPGMFLAVPITAIIKIIMERFEATRGYARLLSGDFSGGDED